MDNVVRLRPGQKLFQAFDHDLLDKANDYKDDPDRVLRHLWVVRRVVGNYLYYWPETEPLLEEMVSAGLQALCEFDKWDKPKALWNRVRHVIEVEINNHKSIVRASFSTNRNLARDKKPLEYAKTKAVHQIGMDDPNLTLVDLLDEMYPDEREKWKNS